MDSFPFANFLLCPPSPPQGVNVRTWAHIITCHVKIRSYRQPPLSASRAWVLSLPNVTCFSTVLLLAVSGAKVRRNIAGGGLVHTIIRQSNHYRSISHILYSGTACHLMLSPSFWTLEPSTSLSRGSTLSMTHLCEMPQTLQIPNYEVTETCAWLHAYLRRAWSPVRTRPQASSWVKQADIFSYFAAICHRCKHIRPNKIFMLLTTSTS